MTSASVSKVTMWRSRWRCVTKPAYSVSFLLSINIFVWQNVLYFLDAPRNKLWKCGKLPFRSWISRTLTLLSKDMRCPIDYEQSYLLVFFGGRKRTLGGPRVEDPWPRLFIKWATNNSLHFVPSHKFYLITTFLKFCTQISPLGGDSKFVSSLLQTLQIAGADSKSHFRRRWGSSYTLANILSIN